MTFDIEWQGSTTKTNNRCICQTSVIKDRGEVNMLAVKIEAPVEKY